MWHSARILAYFNGPFLIKTNQAFFSPPPRHYPAIWLHAAPLVHFAQAAFRPNVPPTSPGTVSSFFSIGLVENPLLADNSAAWCFLGMAAKRAGVKQQRFFDFCLGFVDFEFSRVKGFRGLPNCGKGRSSDGLMWRLWRLWRPHLIVRFSFAPFDVGSQLNDHLAIGKNSQKRRKRRNDKITLFFFF